MSVIIVPLDCEQSLGLGSVFSRSTGRERSGLASLMFDGVAGIVLPNLDSMSFLRWVSEKFIAEGLRDLDLFGDQ